MKEIILLGATGSIGKQTQDIILDNSNDFSLVVALVFHILSNHQNQGAVRGG